jgi:signal transduction histidine kinase
MRRPIEHEIEEIAHDLKSPLGAIALEATLLDDRLVHADRVGGLRSVIRIQQNVAFLDRLVLDLLDVCAMTTGRFRLQRAETEMRTLLEQVIERASGLARHRIFLEAPERVLIDIDELRIERVVANLLDNAIKYSPEASGIVIRLAHDELRVGVSVIDMGPGIAPEELPHVFDRHRRADSSRGTCGSGLGLYVAKRIVDAHGGTISVASIRGAGARFFFTLPRESACAEIT